MLSWGSRGRRFKSGRPDWSEPHFRTQKPDCERPMGAQRAPISPMKPLWEDTTPLVSRGLPSPPMASPPPGTLVSGSKGRRFTPGCPGLGFGNTSRDPSGTRWQPWPTPSVTPLPCYAEYCQRTAFRVLIATAGWTGATVTSPARAELVPEPTSLCACPAAPGVLPLQMPHARGCPAADIAWRCGRCPSHGSQAGPAGSVTVAMETV
jgi:hypothetical protein